MFITYSIVGMESYTSNTQIPLQDKEFEDKVLKELHKELICALSKKNEMDQDKNNKIQNIIRLMARIIFIMNNKIEIMMDVDMNTVYTLKQLFDHKIDFSYNYTIELIAKLLSIHKNNVRKSLNIHEVYYQNLILLDVPIHPFDISLIIKSKETLKEYKFVPKDSVLDELDWGNCNLINQISINTLIEGKSCYVTIRVPKRLDKIKVVCSNAHYIDTEIQEEVHSASKITLRNIIQYKEQKYALLLQKQSLTPEEQEILNSLNNSTEILYQYYENTFSSQTKQTYKFMSEYSKS